MDKIEIYLDGKDKLQRLADLFGVDIESYYTPAIVFDHDTTDQQIAKESGRLFYIFCENLADRQYMSNIIQFEDNRASIFKVLFGEDAKDTGDWNPTLFLNCYPFSVHEKDISECLFNEWIKTDAYKTRMDKYAKNYDIESKDYKSKTDFYKRQWLTYLCGAYQFACYLTKSDIPTFNKDFKCTGVTSYEKMPSLKDVYAPDVQNEQDLADYLLLIRKLWNTLKGVGVAVCCNVLKESGVTTLAKPDTHIMQIVDEMQKAGLLPPVAISKPKGKELYKEEKAVISMYRWAMDIKKQHPEEQISAFKLDRIIYLLCTNGYFYAQKDRDKIISAKTLIAQIQQNGKER